MKNRILIASWSFLLGSALFTADAAFEMVNQTSPTALAHLTEGLLFLIGSVFLLPTSEQV